VKGGGQSDVPRPQVIIPSAAYGGAIISFVLCPSELVKVSQLWLSYISECRLPSVFFLL